jgi:hypothetical protein
MTETFQSKVRTAAIAGWSTWLIAMGVFLVQWIMYLAVVPAEPAWVLALWGPGANWQYVREVWFWFLAGFKVLLVVFAFVLLWLTLWARQLRNGRSAS